MNEETKENDGKPRGLWIWLVNLCKDLQPVITIAALALAALAFLWRQIPNVFPRAYLGPTVHNCALDVLHDAETDGFVTALLDNPESNLFLTGETGPPRHLAVVAAASTQHPAIPKASITFPVRQGQQWRVAVGNGKPANTVIVDWTPLLTK